MRRPRCPRSPPPRCCAPRGRARPRRARRHRRRDAATLTDVATNQVVHAIPVGGRSRAVAAAPDGSRGYVAAGTACARDRPRDPPAGRRREPEPGRRGALAVSADGLRLYAARRGALDVIDPADVRRARVDRAPATVEPDLARRLGRRHPRGRRDRPSPCRDREPRALRADQARRDHRARGRRVRAGPARRLGLVARRARRAPRALRPRRPVPRALRGRPRASAAAAWRSRRPAAARSSAPTAASASP